MIIYKITNNVNNKNYIGQTIHQLQKRISQHKYQSKKSQYPLYRSIRKYGWESFSINIIDTTCETRKELNDMEFHYIKQYHSFCKDNGYNLTYGGDYSPIESEESKLKHKINITKAMQKYTGKNNVMRRKDIKTKHLKSITLITSTDDWKHKKYKGDEKQYDDYLIITPDNKLLQISGLGKFCRDNNLNQPHLSDVSNGRRRTSSDYRVYHINYDKRLLSYNNYIDIFENKNYTFKAKSPDGIIYYSDNVTIFSKHHNLNRSGVYSVLKERQDTHKNWNFYTCNVHDYVDHIERNIKLIIQNQKRNHITSLVNTYL